MDAHSEHTSSTHKPFYDNKLIKKNKVKNEIQKKIQPKKRYNLPVSIWMSA